MSVPGIIEAYGGVTCYTSWFTFWIWLYWRGRSLPTDTI